MSSGKGRLVMIVGCMSCGKSDELIRMLVRSRIARQPTRAYRSLDDIRSPPGKIASRTGSEFPSTSVRSGDEILTHERGVSSHVIGIDEVQFFGTDLISVVDRLIDGGSVVIASGLDTDYAGRPFGIVPHLLAVADKVLKLDAVCMQCGAPATRTQFKIPVPDNPPPGFFIGGDDRYEARCRNCHVPFLTKPL